MLRSDRLPSTTLDAPVLAGVLLLLWLAASCAGPVVKPDALDPAVLSALEERGLVAAAGEEERTVEPVPAWLDTDTESRLVFAGYRDPGAAPGALPTYALVLDVEPEEDRLVLLPLPDGGTPLGALREPERTAHLWRRLREYHEDPASARDALVLSITDVVREKRLGPPIPQPQRILAVAANFPSHLVHDLDVPAEHHAAIADTPPRVFQKHPPLDPPGAQPLPEPLFRGLIGPFDTVLYPAQVTLPEDEEGVTHVVDTYCDYEAEIGVVLGRDLTWEDVRAMSDEELYDAVAGYVLVSDVKARNPQVFERVLARNEVPTEPERRYLTGDPTVDQLIGLWDEETCAWWSYAASQGDYAAVGPFLVAATGAPELEPRAVLCARSYAPVDEREVDLPDDVEPGMLYLRQCARVTEEPGHRDATLWTLPEVLRAILSPTGALDLGRDRRLAEGDVVALGTPGGIALTVNRSGLYRLLDRVLFWWDAVDWHDAFFRKDETRYLHDGDELFLWAEGLGFQHLEVRRLPLTTGAEAGRLVEDEEPIEPEEADVLPEEAEAPELPEPGQVDGPVETVPVETVPVETVPVESGAAAD